MKWVHRYGTSTYIPESSLKSVLHSSILYGHRIVSRHAWAILGSLQVNIDMLVITVLAGWFWNGESLVQKPNSSQENTETLR
jgi:hypothetical protein